MLNPNFRPSAQLLDMLMRPVNCLRFEYHREKYIPHLVLGETDIGGSWTEYDEEVREIEIEGELNESFFRWLLYLWRIG